MFGLRERQSRVSTGFLAVAVPTRVNKRLTVTVDRTIGNHRVSHWLLRLSGGPNQVVVDSKFHQRKAQRARASSQSPRMRNSGQRQAFPFGVVGEGERRSQ